jgi:hypothetical protein
MERGNSFDAQKPDLINLLRRFGKDPDCGPRGELVGGDESAHLSIPALSID